MWFYLYRKLSMSQYFQTAINLNKILKMTLKLKYAKLNTVPDANPNENYCILETAIIESMSNHLQEKVVRFNKKKHKRDPWMTYGILKSVNHNNKLHKELMKLNRNSTEFNNNRQEFII